MIFKYTLCGVGLIILIVFQIKNIQNYLLLKNQYLEWQADICLSYINLSDFDLIVSKDLLYINDNNNQSCLDISDTIDYVDYIGNNNMFI